MLKEFTVQNWKPENIQEKTVNILHSDNWHYIDTDTNQFIPFSIEKSYFVSNQDEGYRLWDRRQNTQKVVAYFEHLEDAQNFIFQAYENL